MKYIAFVLGFIFVCSCSSDGNSGSSNNTNSDTGADSGNTTQGTNDGGGETSDTGNNTGTTDGGSSNDTLYKGAFTTTVSTDGQQLEYAGKLELKLRADGIFSGSGSGASADASATPITLELNGTLNEDKTIGGTVTWAWVDDTNGQSADCELSGAVSDKGFEGSFIGGSQQQNFQGSFLLTE